MDQSHAAEVLHRSFEKSFFDVVDVLTERLGLPNSLVRVAPQLHGIVNGQRMLVINFVGRNVMVSDGNFNLVGFSMDEAACYVPERLAICVSTEALSKEAESARIGEEALLEILVLHEMVHFAMMGSFAKEPRAAAWLLDPIYRYIHEAVALKASEFAFTNLLVAASDEDVRAYLAYVERESEVRGAGGPYREYYKAYRSRPVEQFWGAILEDDWAREITDRIAEI